MKEDITKKLRLRISEAGQPTPHQLPPQAPRVQEAPKAPTAAPQAKANPSDATSKFDGTNYDKIASILNNDIVNTAAICEIVFGDKEATNRSLFRKKLNREPNDNGSTYSFDEEELLKISTALMSFSTQIRKSIGKQGKG